MPANPYRELDDFCFWSRAMTAPAPGQIDPVVDPAMNAKRIESSHKIATMGSCFAQHLSRIVEQAGFNYYVPEAAPEGMAAGVARARGYGVFSARYGNVYTVRQALQLFQRAFGSFHPQEAVWARGGRFVDAFRPQIEPDGFASVAEVAAEAERRFADVIYFPSYEVITSPAAGGRYYADDLHQVTGLGVKHVMRLFKQHFLSSPDLSHPEAGEKSALGPVAALAPDMEVECDEEVIERALRKSGF